MMKNKIYRVVKVYPTYDDIAYCIAPNPDDALRIMEWYPGEEYNATAMEVEDAPQCLTNWQISHETKAKLEAQYKRMQEISEELFPNRGWLDEKQSQKFIDLLYEPSIFKGEEDE